MSFLLILKFLLKLIIILLCLVVFVTVSVLFYPIRYKIKGKVDTENNNICVDGKVTWLYHIVSVFFHVKEVDIKNFDTDVYLKIFFKKKYFFSTEDLEEKTEDLKENKEVLKEPKEDSENSKKFEENSEEEIESSVTTEKNVNDNESLQYKADVQNVNEAQNEKKVNLVTKVKKIFSNILGFLKRIKYKFKSFITNKKNSSNKNTSAVGKLYKKIKMIYNDSDFKYTYAFLKEKIILLLKIICPKKVKGFAEFSLTEPDKTALVTSFFTLFPVFYAKSFHIYPDFNAEKKYVLAEFEMKGSFILLSIIVLLLKVWFNKKVMKFLGKIRRVYNA
ncbi:hypothetical protein [Lachnobacterium bovis]|uniref:hypothetical protein n=1 Tax=Lachnobacterium bovis TaxID=140626 RepID=UPI000482893C|nr:hypothetical protein [Lachnobacterium bovis]